mgnify:CR=1 FL=1
MYSKYFSFLIESRCLYAIVIARVILFKYIDFYMLIKVEAVVHMYVVFYL